MPGSVFINGGPMPGESNFFILDHFNNKESKNNSNSHT